jgi:hypothetical protein
MAITVSHLTSFFSQGNASLYTSGSVTNTANALLVAFVKRRASAQPSVATVNGFGLTWNACGDITYNGGLERLSAYTAQGASSTDTVRITSAALSHCMMSLVEVTGHPANTQPAQSVSSNATALSVLSVLFGSFYSSLNGIVVGVGTGDQTQTINGRVGLIKLGEALGTGTASDSGAVASFWSSSIVTASGFTGTAACDWAGIALEIGIAPEPTTLFLDNPVQSGSAAGRLNPTAPAASTSTTGWTVGATALGNYSRQTFGSERSFTVNATPEPSGAPTASAPDSWRISAVTSGVFGPGVWHSSVSVLAVTAGGAQDGRIRTRLWRSANADGSSPTQITASVMTGTLVTNLSTTVAQSSAASQEIPAVTLTNEYLFLQAAWEVTGAGTATQDVLVRLGPGKTQMTGSGLITSRFSSTVAAGGADPIGAVQRRRRCDLTGMA